MTNRSILHPSFTNDDKRQPAKRPFGLSAKGNCDETPIGHPLPDRNGFLAERMRRRLDAGIADCGKTNRQQCCLPHRQCLSGQHLQKHHKYLLVNAFRCTANTSMQKGRFWVVKGPVLHRKRARMEARNLPFWKPPATQHDTIRIICLSKHPSSPPTGQRIRVGESPTGHESVSYKSCRWWHFPIGYHPLVGILPAGFVLPQPATTAANRQTSRPSIGQCRIGFSWPIWD